MIYAMLTQQVRAANLINYLKTQIDVSFLCVCSVIGDKFRQSSCGSTSYFDNFMMKIMTSNRIDA